MDISKQITKGLRNIEKNSHLFGMSWKNVSFEEISEDILSAINIFLVFLPISISLTFFCGISPIRGVLSSAIAASVAALLGSSRYQIPMISFSLCFVTAEILTKYGYYGLFSVAVLAFSIVIIIGTFRFSDMFRYISDVYLSTIVVCVAVSIAIIHTQILLAVNTNISFHGFFENFIIFFKNIRTVSWRGVLEAAAFICPLLFIKLKVKSHFAYLLYLLLGASVVFISGYFVKAGFLQSFVGTIGDSSYAVHSDAATLSGFIENTPFTQQFFMNALNYAFVIAIIMTSKTCSCTDVTSCLTNKKMSTNAELVSIGVANLLSATFGCGFVSPNTRLTISNIFCKNRTIFTLLVFGLLCFTAFKHGDTIIRYIPEKCVSSILIVFSISAFLEANIASYWRRINDKSYIFFITLFVYVFFGFVPAVIIGFSISMFFFMRRILRMNGSTIMARKNYHLLMNEFLKNKYEPIKSLRIPPTVLSKTELIRIDSALHLNTVRSAKAFLLESGNCPRVLVLYFCNISFLDSEAIEELRLIVSETKRQKCRVFVSGSNSVLIEILKQRERDSKTNGVFGELFLDFNNCINTIRNLKI
jgi:SulP family sulfate permease